MSHPYRLTPREERWLELTANGATRESVQAEMVLTDGERRELMGHAMRKLGAVSLPHVVALAVARGIVSVEESEHGH